MKRQDVLAVALLAAACSSDPPRVGEPGTTEPVGVSVEIVNEASAAETIAVTGVVRPRRTATIAAQVMAQIRDVSCEGKALWVFYNGPVKIRNVRFSGAKVAARNGAGIRWEGRGWLVVENARFDNNQMGYPDP